MTPELRAAAERLRRHHDGCSPAFLESCPYAHQEDGEWFHDHSKIYEDRGLVVDAFLAEHPPDEDEPVTDDWIRSVSNSGRYSGGIKGFKTRGEMRQLCAALGIELREKAT